MRLTLALLVLIALIAVPSHACTFFSYAGSELVLFGNNEDHADPETRLWVVPAEDGLHGCVFLGFGNLFAQGGINDVGLAFDAATVSPNPLNDHPELPTPDPINFCEIVLRECETIDDVVEVIGRYNLSYVTGAQFLFTDRTGATLVVGPGLKRELEFVRTDLPYQVVANSNVVAYPQSLRYDRRHRVPTEAMERIQQGELELSVDTFAGILSEVAARSGSSETAYSNVFDLSNGIIHLYRWHDFANPVVLRVTDYLDVSLLTVYEIDALFPGP